MLFSGRVGLGTNADGETVLTASLDMNLTRFLAQRFEQCREPEFIGTLSPDELKSLLRNRNFEPRQRRTGESLDHNDNVIPDRILRTGQAPHHLEWLLPYVEAVCRFLSDELSAAAQRAFTAGSITAIQRNPLLPNSGLVASAAKEQCRASSRAVRQLKNPLPLAHSQYGEFLSVMRTCDIAYIGHETTADHLMKAIDGGFRPALVARYRESANEAAGNRRLCEDGIGSASEATVRALLGLGVTVDVHGLGPIGRGVGELILAVLAQVADMERHRIAERTSAGRSAAKASLAETGRTHRGKESLGRPRAACSRSVVDWRTKNSASISQAARQFQLSTATVKRYCAEHPRGPESSSGGS